MGIRIFCFLFLTIFLSTHTQDLSARYFRKIGPAEGLEQPTVLAIYEDTLGRMWFGTREGVCMYDGSRVRGFKPETVTEQEKGSRFLIGNEVNRITGNGTGDIFMRSEHSLIRYDIRQETFNMVRTAGVGALETYDGDVCYTVNDSLFRYDAVSDSEVFVRKLGLPDIWCMLVEDDRLWIGTPKGLFLSENGGTPENLLPGIEIYSIFKSSRGEFWISSRRDGLYSIRRDGVLRKEPYGKDKVASSQIREFAEDKDQNIWFGTFDGLQIYNPYTDEYTIITSDNMPGSLSHPSVFSLCRDRHNTMWVGTYYGGVNYVNLSRDIFTYHVVDESRDDCLDYPIVGQMLEDNHRRLWICTDGGGLNCLDRKTGKFRHYRASGPNSVLHDNIKAIAYDRKRDVLYVGTHTGGMSRYDCSTGKFHNYPISTEAGKDPGEIIYCMAFYNDRLYVSSRNGMWILNPATDSFERLFPYSPVLTFCIDSRGFMWMADRTGLLRMNLHTDSVPERMDVDGMPLSCRVTKIYESSSGLVYIATLGQGVKVYDHETAAFTSLTRQENNLTSNYCYNLMETSRNSILMTTDRGLTLYSPFTGLGRPIGRTDVFTAGDGGGIYECLDNRIFVGGMNGMVSFDENTLYKTVGDEVSLYFSELYVNNARVYAGDRTGILENSLPFTGELLLKASQNNLSIVFAVSDYVPYLNGVEYFYKLEGFDQDWISTTSNRLNYTNLPSGKYILKVRAAGDSAGDDGLYGEMPLVIRKPMYGRWWAWFIYSVCLLMSGFAVWRIRRNRRQWADTLKREKEEKQRIEELNKVKLRFFTDVSHEFKTPLTLIIGQIESLLLTEPFPASVGRRLDRIRTNAVRLRLLISELLDFRRQEQGFLRLKVEQHDIVDFVYGIWQAFEENARTRKITYVFEPVEKHIEVWFDPVQMQKVIFNLLSNAFKYTPDGGRIEVGIRRMMQQVEVTVSDNGRGIDEEDRSRIFDRFYRSGDERAVSGTGIGLALSKEIVVAHEGEIDVAGGPGKGSIFSLKLRLGNNHFSPEELEHDRQVYSIDENYLLGAKNEVEERPLPDGQTQDKGKMPVVLIVDDDKEMLELLEQIFSPYYVVHRATDGQKGFAMTAELLPDLVISDVMMPEMSGKELCRRIKTSFELCYIPVVLLTAMDSLEQKVMGYMFGADDYIQKPFNVQLLLARCNNLVNNRRMLLGMKLERKVDMGMSGGLGASDRKIVEKATEAIRQNFDNPDFSMDMLAAELNMSRTKMFNFFKSVLDVTPNDFTLNLKMEEAARMLAESPSSNVSEISYALGFSSPRYFSRCFKAFYNVTPQQYRKGEPGHERQ